MPRLHEIICIECPLACRVQLSVDETGIVQNITGNQCKVGKKYAIQEFESPRRLLTLTVMTEASRRANLPVRSSKPIPKNMLRDCMLLLSEVKAKPSLHIGDTIIANILDTGADVICTDDLLD